MIQVASLLALGVLLLPASTSVQAQSLKLQQNPDIVLQGAWSPRTSPCDNTQDALRTNNTVTLDDAKITVSFAANARGFTLSMDTSPTAMYSIKTAGELTNYGFGNGNPAAQGSSGSKVGDCKVTFSHAFGSSSGASSFNKTVEITRILPRSARRDLSSLDAKRQFELPWIQLNQIDVYINEDPPAGPNPSSSGSSDPNGGKEGDNTSPDGVNQDSSDKGGSGQRAFSIARSLSAISGLFLLLATLVH